MPSTVEAGDFDVVVVVVDELEDELHAESKNAPAKTTTAPRSIALRVIFIFFTPMLCLACEQYFFAVSEW